MRSLASRLAAAAGSIVTDVVVESNQFVGVGTGVCLRAGPTVRNETEYGLVYRNNTGPRDDAPVMLCANCEIAMRTNGYGALDVRDGRARCVPWVPQPELRS